jgi:hypothetical protein
MVSLPPYQFTRDPLDESEKDVLSAIAKLENDSNHASEEIGMFNRLTAIGEDVSLIREKLVEGKPVPARSPIKTTKPDRNKTLTQIGESIAVASRRILRNLVRNKNSPATGHSPIAPSGVAHPKCGA